MSDLAQITIFYGSDEGQSSAAAKESYQILSSQGDSWGDEIIDGAASSVDAALAIIHQTIQALQTMNMFGGRKVIWLKGASFLGDSVQGTKSAAIVAALDALLTCLESLNSDSFFLLSSSEMDKRRVFFKRLVKCATMQENSKIDISKSGWESELSTMVLGLARSRELRFENDALDLFVHRVHENSRQVANELDKLSTYLGKDSRALKVEDIELMVAVSREGVIFEISRAIEKGNVAQAILLIDAQLTRGEQGVTIMRAAIVPTLRSRFMACLLMHNYGLKADNYRQFEAALGRLPEEALKLVPRKKDGTPNAYGLFNAARSCGPSVKLSSLRRALKACADADRALVSSGLDARLVLHQLVATLVL